MPNIYFECAYCGHSWSKLMWGMKEIEEEVCIICKDSSLKVREESDKKDVFGYNSQAPQPDAYFKKKK